MTARRRFLVYIFVVLTSCWGPLFAQLIEFEKIEDYIKNDNTLVQARWYQAESVEQMKGHLSRSFAPDLTLDFGHERYREGNISRFSENFWILRTKVNLYNRSHDLLEEKLIESKSNQANLEYEKQFLQQSFKAKKKYFKLLKLENKKTFLNSHLEEVRLLVESSKERVQNRTMLESDLVRIQIHLSHTQHEISQVQLEMDETKNFLSVLLNFDDHKSLHTKGQFPEKEDHQSIVSGGLDISKQPDIKRMHYLNEQINLKKKQADHWWRPKVDLYASYGRPPGSHEADVARLKEEEVAIGVNINFDIGSSLRKNSLSRSMHFRNKSLLSEKRYQEKELLALDHELRHDLKRLLEMIESAENELEYSTRYLELVRSEFNRGVKEASDLLEAFVQKTESQIKILELNSKYFSKREELVFLNN